jgi:hypothetical protein
MRYATETEADLSHLWPLQLLESNGRGASVKETTGAATIISCFLFCFESVLFCYLMAATAVS